MSGGHPFLTRQYPPVQGEFKHSPEDFVVEEIPAYEPCGSGDHLYVWVEKRNLTTWQAADMLARALGKNPADAGYAGLKDKLAVTRQWFSFEHADTALLDSLADDRIKILNASRHRNKLKTGHLYGNRFTLRLRGRVKTKEDKQTVDAVAAVLCARGCPNYFTEQRFGIKGDNHLLGKQLVMGKRIQLPPSEARNPKVKKLLVSAFQSYLFNQVVAKRIDALDKLMDGDMAYLHRNGACFPVGNAAEEQPRADSFEISPTGPLWGYRMTEAHGVPGEIERSVLAAEGIEKHQFKKVYGARFRGERRPLRFPVREYASSTFAEGLELRFVLPSGCYATAVLREVLKDPDI